MTLEANQIVGRLTLIELCWIVQPTGRKRGWLCKCRCGEIVKKHIFVLKRPLIRGEHSCGCAQKGVPRGCKPGQQRNNGRQNVAKPTREEIAEQTAQIRATWDEDEHDKRRGARHCHWQVPVVSSRGCRDMTGEFS